MKGKKNSGNDLLNQLSFILDKVELERSEKQWLLNYLEDHDDTELMNIMWEIFKLPSSSPDELNHAFWEKILRNIHDKLDK